MDNEKKESTKPSVMQQQGHPVLDWVIIILLAAIVFALGYMVVQFNDLQDEVNELQVETNEDFSRTNNGGEVEEEDEMVD